MAALLIIALLALQGLALRDAAPLKIWIDEVVFREGETNLMQHIIADSQGTLALAGRTRANMIDRTGHKVVQDHDFLWTGRKSCHAAFKNPKISISNAISCTPGTEAITDKAGVVETLASAYGRAADTVMPTAFLLPSQRAELAAHLRSTAYSGVWALKEDVHRGKGVVPVAGGAVLGRLQGLALSKYVVAQRFVDDQLIIDGRPFILRMWAVLSGGSPIVRARLFRGGITPFGDEVLPESATAQQRAESMVVNIFQQNRTKAVDPWSLHDLERHLHQTTGSGKAFNELWNTIQRSTAATLAAAVPSVRAATAPRKLRRYQGGNIEVLGLDFVVDSKLRPWMIEANYLPSMARKVINCTMPGTATAAAGGSGAGASSSSADATKEGGAVVLCKENPMDLEKEAFLAAHLRAVAARRAVIEQHAAEAQAAVAAAEQSSSSSKRRRCSVTADILRQVMDAQSEAEAAVTLGFAYLTPDLYRALRCMSGAKAECVQVLPSINTQGTCDGTSSARIMWYNRALEKVKQVQSLLKKLPFLFDASIGCGKPMRRAVPLAYSPLPIDSAFAAWLQLPKEERGVDASAILEQLCSLEAKHSPWWQFY